MTITPEKAEKLWALIRDIKVGMLVTEADDFLHARPMHLIQDEFSGSLWFFTSKSSGKSGEIIADKQVCLTFADHSDETYVSLTGTAWLDHDQAKIEKFWTPFASAYFPQGKNDPDLTLLRVDVHKAEYWDANSSRMVQLFKILKANVTKEMPHLGEHRQVG